jgi:osmotically-inducible protein OsmY
MEARRDVMPRVQEEIKQDVVDQLVWDDRVNAAEVDVEVGDSAVVLRGSVPNYWARLAAVEDAESIAGVARVEDQMAVRWPPVYTPNDADLSENVDRVLRWNPNTDASRLTISVSDGVVSLEGSVDSYWKKQHAERVAADVAGVIDVENRLAIVPTRRVTDETIANDIVNALKRNMLVDAELIDVRVTNGVVTLSGSVPNWAALRAARSAAYQTAGVVDVRDTLAISV